MTTEEHILANPVLRAVQDVLDNQVAKGHAKYGNTVNPQDYTTQQWINHASEEAMDFVVYLQTLATKMDDMQHRFNEMQTALKMILDDTITVTDYEESIHNVRYIAQQGLNEQHILHNLE